MLIEVLASGLPLIFAKCCGSEEFINQVNGLLVDTKNLEQLGEAMQIMVQGHYENGLQALNPQNLRNEALIRFGEEAFVKNAISYYQKALANN